PLRSIGRRMSPDYVVTKEHLSVRATIDRVKRFADEAETIYLLPVIDDGRRVVGVVSLRQLLTADDETLVGDVMQEAHTAVATDDAEAVARRTTELGVIAMPIVDSEHRLVGIFTIDDAVKIIEH